MKGEYRENQYDFERKNESSIMRAGEKKECASDNPFHIGDRCWF